FFILIEQLFQLGAGGITDQLQHHPEPACGGRIVHFPQVRYQAFLVDSSRGRPLLPRLEDDLGTATVERLVEGIQQGLLQRGDPHAGAWSVAPNLDSRNQAGGPARAVKRNSLVTKKQRSEARRRSLPGSRGFARPPWVLSFHIFVWWDAAWGPQFSHVVVFDRLSCQRVKSDRAKITNDPQRFACH